MREANLAGRPNVNPALQTTIVCGPGFRRHLLMSIEPTALGDRSRAHSWLSSFAASRVTPARRRRLQLTVTDHTCCSPLVQGIVTSTARMTSRVSLRKDLWQRLADSKTKRGAVAQQLISKVKALT